MMMRQVESIHEEASNYDACLACMYRYKYTLTLCKTMTMTPILLTVISKMHPYIIQDDYRSRSADKIPIHSLSTDLKGIYYIQFQEGNPVYHLVNP